jgi:MYXO-CTERM domain-containing protein
LTCTDADSDGYNDYACGGDDCDDNNAAIHPGATEICNGIDDNCDGVTDEGFDKDSDGYKTCGTAIDCDDNNAAIHPGATEVCGNNIDEDCSGADLKCECADNDHDGFRDKTCGGTDCNDNNNTVNPSAVEICDQIDNNCDGQTDEGDVCKKDDSGCSCASSSGSVASSGLLVLMALGLSWFRRRS